MGSQRAGLGPGIGRDLRGRGMTTKKCPKCGSINIKRHRLPHFWPKWECFNCGYVGALIIEDGKLPYPKGTNTRYRKRHSGYHSIPRRGRKW